MGDVKKLFKIMDQNGQAIGKGELARDELPAVGQEIVRFNFPFVERFVVWQIQDRKDWFVYDWLEPQAVVVRPFVSASDPGPGVLAFRSADHIDTRLKKCLQRALTEIPGKLTLRLSRADFLTLCRALPAPDVDIDRFDILAYRDCPLEILDEDYARSHFDGYDLGNGDMAPVYVCKKDGSPFSVDPRFAKIVDDVLGKRVTRPGALSAFYDIVGVTPSDKAWLSLDKRVKTVLDLVEDNVFSPYLAAQELTDLGEYATLTLV